MKDTNSGLIYVRVSSDSQLENNGGHGLKSQEISCREFAKNKGIIINKVFTDGGVSGKLLSREGLDGMINYLKTENKQFTKIAFVIVDDIDRISRDIIGRWEIKKLIDTTGAKLVSLKQNLDDTPEGVLQQNIIMSFKQFERENNARRVRDRQRARMLDGFRPLYAPQGYENTRGKDGKKAILPVQPQATMIQEGLELFACGSFTTKEELRTYLSSKGFHSRQTKKVTRGSVDRMLTKATLLFYAGYIHYLPREVEMIEAKHEAIISLDTANKVLERLNPKTFYKNHTYTDIDLKMPLRSVIRCEHCNHPLTGGPTINRWGTTYYYYSCRQKGCEIYGKSFSSKQIHDAFETKLKTLAIQKPIIDLFGLICNDYRKDRSKNIEHNSKTGKSEIKKINTDIEKIQSRIIETDDIRLITMYEGTLKTLYDKKQEHEKTLCSSDEVEINVGSLFQECKVFLENPYLIREQSDIESKRLFTRVLFNNSLTYSRKGGVGTGDIPVIYSDLAMSNTTNSYLVEMIGIEPMSERDRHDFLPLESLN